MGRLGGILLALAALAAAGDRLSGTIAGGKAKKLRDEGLALVKQADAVWKRWILEQIEEASLEAELKRAVDLYDRGTAKLNDAVEIENDPGVNHRLRLAATKLAKMRARLLWLEERRRIRERPPAPEKPATPETPAEPEPEPGPPPPRADESEPPPPAASFAPDEPPARPVDVELKRLGLYENNPDLASMAKRDGRAIRDALKKWYGARKPNKLTFRHKMCAGKGVFRDGTKCEECGGTGRLINLYHFRKVFWTAYSPMLRDAAGALDALKAFHARAQRDPEALGPAVKSFRVEEVDYHGYWARARVSARTTAGDEQRTITLVAVGSRWFFFNPETDKDLLPVYRLD